MGNTKREKFQIMAEILEHAEGGAGKTKIMYASNLNHVRVSKYLDLLEEKGFIKSKRESQPEYTTTEKGMTFLQNFKDLKEQFENSG